MKKTLGYLDLKPEFFDLNIGLDSGEVAPNNEVLWSATNNALETYATSWHLETHSLDANDEGQGSNSDHECPCKRCVHPIGNCG